MNRRRDCCNEFAKVNTFNQKNRKPRKSADPVHRVTGKLNLVELTKTGSALTLEVFQRNRKLGTIVIGQGSFFWFGHNRRQEKEWSWSDFARLMDRHAYDEGIYWPLKLNAEAFRAEEQAAPSPRHPCTCRPVIPGYRQGWRGNSSGQRVRKFRLPWQARCSLTARRSLNHRGERHTSANTPAPGRSQVQVPGSRQRNGG